MLTTVLFTPQQKDSILALHCRRDTIAQKFGFRAQFTNDADLVSRGDVVKGGDWRMVRYWKGR
jgi:hypothetical protein